MSTTTAADLHIGDTLVDWTDPADDWYHATITAITADTYAGADGYTITSTLHRDGASRTVFMAAGDKVKVAR